jgi:hypothetical protein
MAIAVLNDPSEKPDNLTDFHGKEPHPSMPARKDIAKGQLLIGGRWRDSSSGETMTTTDPTTEAAITTVAKATPEDAQAAIDSAYDAFEEGPWGKMHHEERAKILFKMADLMDERADDFAIREAMDMGMPYTDFRTIIMPHCSGLFRFFAGQAMSAMNGTYRTSYEHDIRILTRREPLGVVAAITPWNFPLALTCSKVAPGLAGPGQTPLFGQCLPARTRSRQHEGRVLGRAHEHVSTRWIAANRIFRRREQLSGCPSHLKHRQESDCPKSRFGRGTNHLRGAVLGKSLAARSPAERSPAYPPR